ncbi:MAG: gamma carbonic anhydrase family protein [Acidimicrobiia bacterium]|nr:gamma carbonic anhydrase family protein [Acidimicrobiia bacterium]
MPIYALGTIEPDIHPDAFVHPDAVVIGDVVVGALASLWPGAVLRGDYGHISIGAGTSIQDGSVIHATAEIPTLVGADCVVGHLAHLECCTIEDRVLVGSQSVVLHEALVRTGALVAAAALVPNRMEVPSGQMAVGVPAKLRPNSMPAEEITRNVSSYKANALRYRSELRRIDEPEMT